MTKILRPSKKDKFKMMVYYKEGETIKRIKI
jgi:hypothetical protein